MSQDKLRHGGCQCGGVRYELRGPALKLYVCHCNECRKQSASAFGVSVFVPREALCVTRGTPRWWSRPTDSGHVLDCAFCGDCGSRLWHQRSAQAETITVRAGSLDEPVDLGGAVHIWVSRKMPGIMIPDATVCFAREPG